MNRRDFIKGLLSLGISALVPQSVDRTSTYQIGVDWAKDGDDYSSVVVIQCYPCFLSHGFPSISWDWC
jgi:hypothetical protein